MIHDLNFRIETDSTQKVTALRGKLATLLEQDEDVSLIHDGQAQMETSYTVSGVNTQTSEPFTEQVSAASEDEARKKSTTKTKVVAVITPLP